MQLPNGDDRVIKFKEQGEFHQLLLRLQGRIKVHDWRGSNITSVHSLTQNTTILTFLTDEKKWRNSMPLMTEDSFNKKNITS